MVDLNVCPTCGGQLFPVAGGNTREGKELPVYVAQCCDGCQEYVLYDIPGRKRTILKREFGDRFTLGSGSDYEGCRNLVKTLEKVSPDAWEHF